MIPEKNYSGIIYIYFSFIIHGIVFIETVRNIIPKIALSGVLTAV